MDENVRLSIGPVSDDDSLTVAYRDTYDAKRKADAARQILELAGQNGVTVLPEITVTPDETPDIAEEPAGIGSGISPDAAAVEGGDPTDAGAEAGGLTAGGVASAVWGGTKAVVGDVALGGTEAIPQAFGGFMDAVKNADRALQSLLPQLGGMKLFDAEGNFDPSLIGPEEMKALHDAEQTLFDMVAPDDADSVTGGMVRAVSQFLTGFLPGVGAARALGVTGWAGSMMGGAIADAVVFDPHEDRLSTMLNEVPILQGIVPDYLADTGPDHQGEWEGRLKNAIEGAGLGALTDGLLSAFKYYKAQRRLPPPGEAQGAQAQASRDMQQAAAKAEMENQVSDEMLLPLGDASPDAPLVVSTRPDDTLATSLKRVRDADARAAKLIEQGDAVQKIREIVARRPAPQAVPTGDTPRDAMDDLLDALRSGKGPAAKLPARPVSAIVKSLGGVDPSSSLAGDLRSRGITAKSFPGLFKRGGLDSLDNIPASEHPLFLDNATPRGDGYIDEQSFIDGLEAELKGDPWRTADELATIEEQIAPLEDLEEHLSRLGINYENLSNDAVKRRLADIEAEYAAEEEWLRSVSARRSEDDAARTFADLDDEQREIWSVEKIAEARAAGVSEDVIRQHQPAKVYINMARINTSDDIKALIQTLADADEAAIKDKTRGVVSNAQTIKESSQEYRDLNDLIGRAPGPMSAAQAVAARRVLASSAEQVAELARIAANPGASPVDQYNFRRAISVHAAIQAEVIGARTETARALQSWSIPIGSSTARTEAVSELVAMGTGGNLQKLAKSIAGVTDETQINQIARDMVKMRTSDALYSVYVNGLLSGPKTHLVNMLSNAAVSMWAIPEKMVARGISKAFYDGEVASGEAMAQAFGMVQGIRDGMRLAALGPKAAGVEDVAHLWDTFGKTELRQNPISGAAFELDPNNPMSRGLDVLGSAINVPGTLLEREDLFFKAVNYRMTLHAAAHREASLLGLEGEAFANKVSEILLNPPAHVADEATKMAAINTFTNPLGPTMQKWQSAISNSTARWVMPFVRTPTNIMKYTFARTPLAYASSAIRADIAAGGARAAEAHARVALGTMMMMTVAGMTMDGTVTGGGPLDPNLQKMWRQAGNQPYSIKVGDQWFAYSRMDPIGMMMGISADIASITALPHRGELDDDELVMAGVTALAQNLASKTYIAGATDFLAAIDPYNPMGSPGKFVEGYAGSLVPYSAFLRQTAQFVDPIQRETKEPVVQDDGTTDALAGYLNSLINRAKKGIPGLSDELPPVRDIFGKPMTYQSGIGPIYDMVSPIQSKDAEGDPVAKEIIANEVGLSKITDIVQGVRLTAEEYDELQQIAGPMLHENLSKIMSRGTYLRHPVAKDGVRAEVIRDVRNKVYQAARAQFMKQNPQVVERIRTKQLNSRDRLLGVQ